MFRQKKSKMDEITFPLLAISRLRMTTDGAGVTTLVAAAGCPLRCGWCLNPQSWNGAAKAEPVTPKTLYDRVKVDDLYFRTTGGGVTFGGGEPLLHADFIAAFRKICGVDWKIRAETSLNVPRTCVETAACVDEFIVDIRDMNPTIYRAYTGCENTRVIENLKRLLETVGADRVLARVPRIPDYNTDADTDRSIDALRALGVKRFDRFNYIIRKPSE